MRLTMRLNETKTKNKRTSQEEVLAEMFAEAELQGSVRKKKNWDAWLEQEEEQQSEKELQVYLEEYSDPTLYLTPKEVKAWNRMPKSKQKRLLQKDPNRYSKSGRQGSERSSLATNGIRRIHGRSGLLQSGTSPSGMQKSGRTGQKGIWKPEGVSGMQEPSRGNAFPPFGQMQSSSRPGRAGRAGSRNLGISGRESLDPR